MEVLRFIHADYDVIVRTQDISYSWERFKGRINYSRTQNHEVGAPEKYCRYTSSDECVLQLHSPITNEKFDFETGVVWDNLWPVVFETCKYQIRLLFHGVDIDCIPEIRHVRKDVEDSFFFDDETIEREEKSITGELDFLNEPGVFKLDFSYKKNGIRKESSVTFDVVSPKLDTKNDYKTLLREVNEEYENVIYRYLSITLQQFSRGRLNTDATWMAAFQGVVDDYVKNVKRVIQNPHSQIVNYRTSRKAEQIKFWTPEMEERYGEVEKEGKLEEYYFGFNEVRSTIDTTENRFVKHTLQSIGSRLSSIITTVLSSSQEELSDDKRGASGPEPVPVHQFHDKIHNGYDHGNKPDEEADKGRHPQHDLRVGGDAYHRVIIERPEIILALSRPPVRSFIEDRGIVISKLRDHAP